MRFFLENENANSQYILFKNQMFVTYVFNNHIKYLCVPGGSGLPMTLFESLWSFSSKYE